MALMISSLVDLPVGELLLVVAVGEALLVVTVEELVMGESWLFIFIAHNLEVCWFLVPFAFLSVLCGKSFRAFSLISAHLRNLRRMVLFVLIRVHSRPFAAKSLALR
jgi:hypothetical protein